MFVNVWNITIESTILPSPSWIDAPGWSDHISKYNSIRYYSSLDSFNPDALATTIESLTCPPHCGKEADIKELSFTHYPNLQSIHISSYSFPHVLSVEVRGLEQLKEFVVEYHCFEHAQTDLHVNRCSIKNCPLLEGIDIGYGSFGDYSEFSLESCSASVEWRIDLPLLKSLTVGSEELQSCFNMATVFELRGYHEFKW